MGAFSSPPLSYPTPRGFLARRKISMGVHVCEFDIEQAGLKMSALAFVSISPGPTTRLIMWGRRRTDRMAAQVTTPTRVVDMK
jgi:hypothetical protein